MKTLKNKAAIKHMIADLLNGNVDEGKFNFQVDKAALDEAIKEMQSGQPIFESPKDTLKLKTKKMLKIGDNYASRTT